jgi:hypothetical protein
VVPSAVASSSLTPRGTPPSGAGAAAAAGSSPSPSPSLAGKATKRASTPTRLSMR